MSQDLPMPDKPEAFVETSLMREFMLRTLSFAPYGGVCGWLGEPGSGKTALATHLLKKVNEGNLSDGGCSFRAAYYQVSTFSVDHGYQGMKRVLKSFYEGVFRLPLNYGFYCKSSPETLTDFILESLKANQTQIVFIDNAELISPSSARALLYLQSSARQGGWPLFAGSHWREEASS
jgi:hypothetical protein